MSQRNIDDAKEATSIRLEHYKDSETSSLVNSEDLEAPRRDESKSTYSPPARRRRSCFWNPCTAIPLLIVFLLLGVAVGTWSAPKLPSWVKDRVKKLPGFDDIYSYGTSLLPVHRPWTDAIDYKPIDLPHSCLSLPKGTMSRLRAAEKPMVILVANNQTVSATSNLTAPVSVCVLVSLPQREFREGSYPDAPVPGKGPDTVHMYMNSSDVIVTMPPLYPYPNQPEAELQFSKVPIVYFAETAIFNAGTYIITGERELSNWLWAQEWHIGEGNSWNMVTGEPPGDVVADHTYHPEALPQTEFTVGGSRHFPARPPCTDITTAGRGRWYKYRSFPMLSRDLVDEWGYTWQGDQCYLDYMSPLDCVDCLADKTIHLYGDSMVRRIAKTIMSGGKWCLDPYNSCQDEDDDLTEPMRKLDIDDDGGVVFDEILRESHFQKADRSSIDFGKNTSIYFTFLTAMAGNPSMWMDRFYDANDTFAPNPPTGADMAVLPNTTARAPPDFKPADLVIVGFGAWDQAFTDRYDDYEQRLYQFRDALLEAYPNTPIILRLSNQWCCRGTHSLFRRYTGTRIQEFDDRTRKVFEVDDGQAMGGRIRVFDPAMMNGRPDVIHDYQISNPNHPRASHVRIEMQMMMNSLCKRGRDGAIEFRG